MKLNLKRVAMTVGIAATLVAGPWISGEKPSETWLQRALPGVEASVAQITTYDENGRPLAEGTGFVVAQDGIICTNYHVIRMAGAIKVKLHDGQDMDVTGIVAFDRDKDFALLKVPANNLPALALDDSDQVKVGEPVGAVGNPLGLQWSVFQGIVSQVHPNDNDSIQLNIAAAPGSSGGPLIDPSGKVIGIITAIARDGEDITFAVPINLVRRALGSQSSNSESVETYYAGETSHAKEELLSQFHTYTDPNGAFRALIPNDWSSDRATNHYVEGTETITTFTPGDDSGLEIRVNTFAVSRDTQSSADAVSEAQKEAIQKWVSGYQNIQRVRLDGVDRDAWTAVDGNGRRVLLLSLNSNTTTILVQFAAPGKDDLRDTLATVFSGSFQSA